MLHLSFFRLLGSKFLFKSKKNWTEKYWQTTVSQTGRTSESSWAPSATCWCGGRSASATSLWWWGTHPSGGSCPTVGPLWLWGFSFLLANICFPKHLPIHPGYILYNKIEWDELPVMGQLFRHLRAAVTDSLHPHLYLSSILISFLCPWHALIGFPPGYPGNSSSHGFLHVTTPHKRTHP